MKFLADILAATLIGWSLCMIGLILWLAYKIVAAL